MKVLICLTVSSDGYLAGRYGDTSRISVQARAQFARLVDGVGNMVVGRRTYDSMSREKLFDHLQDPFVTIMSKHNYPSQPNRHFTHAKPKNILKLLDEKGRSSTVIAGGLQVSRLFLEQGLVDQLIINEEPVNIREGSKFTDMIPAKVSLTKLSRHEYPPGHVQKVYRVSNDTSSHSE